MSQWVDADIYLISAPSIKARRPRDTAGCRKFAIQLRIIDPRIIQSLPDPLSNRDADCTANETPAKRLADDILGGFSPSRRKSLQPFRVANTRLDNLSVR